MTSKPRKPTDYHCKLLPHIKEKVMSAQEVGQRMGWEITAFNLPQAWNFTRGEGVKVAVLDTGCDTKHPDLSDNLLYGRNFLNNTDNFNDDNGHGTHVSGIIAAQDNAIGIVGVAPKCKLIIGKVLDKRGDGDLRTVAAGIKWAADQGVDFITMSLGSPSPVSQVRKAIQYAVSKGAVIFCAAGNAGKTREIFYPAAYPETIGIGAIDENFNRAEFSCTGSDLDFLAPGVKILSTVPGGKYMVMSGTSMANPFVVGIAALVLSYKRNKNIDMKLNSAEDYRTVFKKYCTSTTNPDYAGKKFFEGFGIIDPRKMEEWVKTHN